MRGVYFAGTDVELQAYFFHMHMNRLSSKILPLIKCICIAFSRAISDCIVKFANLCDANARLTHPNNYHTTYLLLEKDLTHTLHASVNLKDETE